MSLDLANELVRIVDVFSKEFPEAYNNFYTETFADEEKISKENKNKYEEAKSLYNDAIFQYRKSSRNKNTKINNHHVKKDASVLIEKYNNYIALRRKFEFTYPCIREYYNSCRKGQIDYISSSEMVAKTTKNEPTPIESTGDSSGDTRITSARTSFPFFNKRKHESDDKKDTINQKLLTSKKNKMATTHKSNELPKPKFGDENKLDEENNIDWQDVDDSLDEYPDSIIETEESQEFVANTEDSVELKNCYF